MIDALVFRFMCIIFVLKLPSMTNIYHLFGSGGVETIPGLDVDRRVRAHDCPQCDVTFQSRDAKRWSFVLSWFGSVKRSSNFSRTL